jgi:hypothetical protein
VKRFSVLRGLALAASALALCVTFAAVAGLYGCSGGPDPGAWFVVVLLIYGMFELPAIAVAFIVGALVPVQSSRRTALWWIALTVAACIALAVIMITAFGVRPMECGS